MRSGLIRSEERGMGILGRRGDRERGERHTKTLVMYYFVIWI